MKRFLTILIAIGCVCCSMLFISCKKEQTPVVEPVFATLSFDVGEFVCTAPQPQTVEVGKALGEFPLPEGLDIAEGYNAFWFLNPEKTQKLSSDAVIQGDAVLYLGAEAAVYSITYTYDSSLTFVGEFPSSYTFGKEQPLPQCNMGKGYQHLGKWVFGEGEEDFFSTAVPADKSGDLSLTFVAQPISYSISYDSGISPEYTSQMQHSNPLSYDVTMGTVTLLPASIEGKTFKHWIFRTTGQDELDKHVITQLTLDFVYPRRVCLWAVWE